MDEQMNKSTDAGMIRPLLNHLCALYGDTFLKEILMGQSVQTVEIVGMDKDVCLHEKCFAVLQQNGPDWRTLPDGPLRRAYEEADAARAASRQGEEQP